MPEPVPPSASPLWIACLCAAWCRTCDDYRSTFERVATDAGVADLRWIDIEDESELVGDIDIETFPTLLIGDAARLRFAGPVLPQPDVLRRLLAALVEAPAAPAAGVTAELEALAVRLRGQRAAPRA